MTPEWKTAVNSRNAKRIARRQAKRAERAEWDVILNKYPHIVPPRRAKRLYQILGIDKLDKKLISKEWIEYQKQGWVYVRALKSQRSETIPENTNGWGDRVLFSKKRTLEKVP